MVLVKLSWFKPLTAEPRFHCKISMKLHTDTRRGIDHYWYIFMYSPALSKIVKTVPEMSKSNGKKLNKNLGRSWYSSTHDIKSPWKTFF